MTCRSLPICLTILGSLEASLDGDDPLWAEHLELQVGVVGDDHELGKRLLTKEGVVDAGEVNHLEGEWLLTEVVQLAEGVI